MAKRKKKKIGRRKGGKKRAMNYGVEAGMIPFNPIRGYKVAKSNARKTYITPEQEAA